MRAPVLLRRRILAGFMRRMDRLYFAEAEGWAKPYGICTFANSSLLPVLRELGTPGVLVGCPDKAMAGTGLHRRGLAGGHDWVATQHAIYDPWAVLYIRTNPVVIRGSAEAMALYPAEDLWECVTPDDAWLEDSSDDWAAYFQQEVWEEPDRSGTTNDRSAASGQVLQPGRLKRDTDPLWMRALSREASA